MTDQQALWNQKHTAGAHAKYGSEPHKFALSVVSNIPSGANILELGCGVGNDARFFAAKGFTVAATDFAAAVIEQNKAYDNPTNLTFTVVDMTQPLPYGEQTFAVIYAHLSLHYFTDVKTREIIHELARVLKPRGRLYFNCKSLKDPKYGHGTELELNIFEYQDHVRHFFSVEYTRDILVDDFTVSSLSETQATYVGETSAFVECWAQKKG